MSILGGGGLFGYGFGSPGGGGSTQSGSSQSQQATQIVPGMMGVYSQLLGLNQGNYQNVLSAYTQGQNRQASQLPGIYQGYGQLQGDVANTLGMGQVLGQNGNWGVATPAAQAIERQYAQARGDTTQSLANAGLGNTTAAQNFQNQNAYNAAQSYGNLGAQLAQTAAGYQSQIGQAGLGAQMQGSQAQAQLAAQRGSSLAGYNFANTAGGLTGGFGSSSSTQTGQSQSRGGYPGGGSAQPSDYLRPQETGGTAPGFAGGGGAGYAGGGFAGTPGYSTGTAYGSPADSGGGGYFAGSVRAAGQGIPGMTAQNPGGFSVTDFSNIGRPTNDWSGAMNQQPNYQQPGMTNENPGGFSAGEAAGYTPIDQQTGLPTGDVGPGGVNPAGGLGGTYKDPKTGQNIEVGPNVPSKPPRPGMTPVIGRTGNAVQPDGSIGKPSIIGWGD